MNYYSFSTKEIGLLSLIITSITLKLRIYFCLLLIILLKLGLAQSDSIQIPYLGTCEEGISKANNNALLDSFVIMGGGLPSPDFSDYSIFLESYWEENYHTREYANCIMSPEVKCYNKEIVKLFNAKYGEHIADTIDKYARIEFAKSIPSKINANHIFNGLDTNASFPHGADSLLAFVFKRLEKKELKCQLYFEVIVERDGSVSELTDLSTLSCLPSNAKSWVSEMPLWEPAICHGFMVRSRYVFSDAAYFQNPKNTYSKRH
jgi:hypothetical protein